MFGWFKKSQQKKIVTLTKPLIDQIEQWKQKCEMEKKVVSSLSEVNKTRKEIIATQEETIEELKKVIDKQSFDALVLNKQLAEKNDEVCALSYARQALLGELSKVAGQQQKNANPKSNDVFWIIWCPSSDSKPTIRHWTFESAHAESMRLAQKNENKEFFVMKMEGMAVTNKSAFYDFRDSQIPF